MFYHVYRLSSSESTDGSDISTSTLTSFLTTIQFAASVISSNDTAMTHTLTSALILRKIIHTGSYALTWTTITECASTLSDHTTSTATVTATTTATATVFNTALMEEIRTELMAVRASYDSKIPFVEACESYGKACAYPGIK